MIGPGIYDDLCTKVREETEATAALIIVFGGKDGSGFSVQAPEGFTEVLPNLLRTIADEIEVDLRGEMQ